MAQYKVEVKRTAAKELADLNPDLAKKILSALEELASKPMPRQSKKLTASRNSYRLRIGDYRVLYQVDKRSKKVVVFAVGHRREIYK